MAVYTLKCTFEVVVEADGMDEAFAHASNVFLPNEELGDEVLDVDHGYNMEIQWEKSNG